MRRIYMLMTALSMLLIGCTAPATVVPTPAPTQPIATTQPTTTPSSTPQLSGAQPLVPIEIVLDTSAIRGSGTIEIVDAAGTVVLAQPMTIEGDSTALTVIPRGAVGPARAQWRSDTGVTLLADVVYTLDPISTVQTDDPVFGAVFADTVRYIQGSMRSYPLNGTVIRGYRSPDNPLLWLRDHVYQGRGFRYFETDVTSLLNAFRDAQNPDGSLPDWVDAPELGVTAGRKDVESDLEFLYVQGIYEAWQMTGDDAWMIDMLPSARRAIVYTTTDPLRWNSERGLIRRPYTIDMWDFEYGPTTTNPETGAPAPRHWIDDQTIWGSFHGDNTGLVQALRMLAVMETRAGNEANATQYRTQADDLQKRVMELHWNGSFLRHFVPEDPDWRPEGVDTEAQLSISNAYALNRGVLSPAQAATVISTYYQRGVANPNVLLPWFSIEPPFPPYAYGMAGRKGELPGEYVNGGIMPVVGGELARGAFTVKSEQFGFDTLRHYHVLTSRHGGSYLWYYPNGEPGISGPDTIPTDGWGAAAMLGALMEGAAGITDPGFAFLASRVTPRWQYGGVNEAYVVARYAAGSGYVAYRWQKQPGAIRFEMTGSGQFTTLHLPMELGTFDRAEVALNGVSRNDLKQRLDGIPHVVLTTNDATQGVSHVIEVTWTE